MALNKFAVLVPHFGNSWSITNTAKWLSFILVAGSIVRRRHKMAKGFKTKYFPPGIAVTKGIRTILV